jgi:hypothetical protein
VLGGQRGDKVVHISQGDRIQLDVALFEVLQKLRDVAAVIFERFLCEVAPPLRPVLLH